MPRGAGRGDPYAQQATLDVREARRQSGDRAATARCAAQGAEGLEDPGDPRAPARHAAQGGRERAVRHRRQGPRDARRRDRPQPRVRGKSRELRCHQGQGGAGRAPRRAGFVGRRGRGGRLLASQEGPGRARRHMGRGRERDRLEREHRAVVRATGPAGGCRGAPRRGPRRGALGRCGEARGGVRAAVPRPRHHGADELRRPRPRGPRGYPGADPVSEGGVGMPYTIPNVHVDYLLTDTGIPVGFWRSVNNSFNAFAVESFIDELAHAAKRDPYEFRRDLLGKAPRHLGALNLAASKAGWGTAPPAGRARGIAVYKAFESYVAEVAEVSVASDGAVKVHRVVRAVDCGPVVNPSIVEAQMESAIVFGLTAALYGEIAIEGGRVKQSNFHDYPMVRLAEMPKIEVHIVPSTDAQGGVGDAGTPPIAPAVCNAIFAATGKRVRKLPIGKVV